MTSYHGGVHLGLLGDDDLLPDLAVLGDGVPAAASELVALAGGTPSRPRRPAGAIPGGR